MVGMELSERSSIYCMAEMKHKFLSSVSYTLSSNLTSFLINALILLIVPKLIGSVEYGYFQYYTFLATYTAYFHFGICNGIMLKDSGKDYDALNKKTLSSQHKLLIEFAALICIGFQFFSFLGNFEDRDKLYMLRLMAVIILFVNSRVFTTSVLLSTSRFKEYSHVIMIEKVLYAIFLSVALLAGVRDYHILILGDVFGKFAACLLGIFYCHEIILAKSIGRKEAFLELVDNFKIGFFILISNLGSLFITGIIQFFVEDQWDIETFGKVSLSLSISKMLMLVINAVSSVLLPFLRKLDEKKLPEMYGKLRMPLMLVLIVFLLAYYPMKMILELWLPRYRESIFYASFLFPMCLFESKTAMLINTYLKAIRKERWLCAANIITVAISLVLSLLTVYVCKNLLITVMLIPLLFAFRCLILEYPLSKILHISVIKEALQEVAVAALFIAFNYFFSSWLAFLLYLGVVVCYILIHKKSILSLFRKGKGTA